MNEQQRRMHDAAIAHYVRGETMAAIARKMGVSRSTISRLLSQARDEGLVHISVALPAQLSEAGEMLEREFGIKTHVADIAHAVSDAERLSEVCRVAGRLLGHRLSAASDQVIGFAWGTTISEMVRHLVPVPDSRSTVVQMNGAANHQTFGIPYASSILAQASAKLGGRIVEFPVPAFFDNPETRELLWKERSVKRVVDIQKKIDIAVFGVGSFGGPLASHVYAAGYLDPEQIALLQREGVVGDICTVMLRADGSWKDLAINQRASGLNPDELKRFPQRLCIAASPAKAAPLLAALKAGVITDLIVDETTAQAVCQLHQGHKVSHGRFYL